MHGIFEARRLNNLGLNNDTTKKQIVSNFDSNASNKHKLLNSKLWNNSKVELQSIGGNCLQQEKEIIEEGSKKLLQIHSEFLEQQYVPLQQINGLIQEPMATIKNNNCFSNNCYEVQKQQLKGGEGFSSLVFTPKLVDKKKGKNDVHMVEEAQQSYGYVEDALLSTQKDFTSPVSPNKDERKQWCFAILNNAKVAAKELNANISIPIFSTRFEKKSSISGCTESLARSLPNDRASSTNSVNGGDEVIQDVTSLEKTFNYNKFDVQKSDHLNLLQSSNNERSALEATNSITKVEEVVQHVEISAIQLETAQFEKNGELETIDRINDGKIEIIFEHKQAEKKNPLSHVFKDDNVDFLSKVHETGIYYFYSLILDNFELRSNAMSNFRRVFNL